MKKKTMVALLLVVTLLFTACSAPQANVQPPVNTQTTATQTPVSGSKMKDLEFFCTTLEQKHKNLFANISKEDFEAEKQKISKNVNSMTNAEFYYALKHLLSLVGDAHTDIAFNDSQYQYLDALGFAVGKYSDGWHLMMLEEQNKDYLGYLLVGINDVKMDDVFQKAKSIMSVETEAWAQKQLSNTINFAQALEYLGIVEKGDSILLQIQKDSNSPTQTLEIFPMTQEQIMKANILSVTPTSIPATAPQGIYRALSLDESTYLIQYNSCQEDPALPMKDFVQAVSRSLKQNAKPYSKIAVDLRYNSGGNSAILEPMITMLQKLQKEQKFEVYILIGERTFSSGIINAVQLQSSLAGTLVGAPTGGSVNGYGELKNFALPNSPFTVWYSTKYFELIKGYDKDGLYPAIEVEQKFEDYRNGVDAEIQTVKNLPA